ncbi:alpha/beta hydrolase family protein [Streptomyces aurantiacus]|nr:alpha/beta fold hydrolase [Streptomyces aurantiacus]
MAGHPTIEAARAWMLEHVELGRYPFNAIDADMVRQVIHDLPGTDPVTWASAWLAPAAEHAARAETAEAAGDTAAARDAWWQAYSCAFLGRYPAPNHPAKAAAYDRVLEYFARAIALEEEPSERVVRQFAGRADEGSQVAFYVRRPAGAERPPVVIVWGGIDGWKEESYVLTRGLTAAGFATVHVDMPGVGEAPVLAGIDAERIWDPVFEWIDGSDLGDSQIAVLGQSYGGYWATKLAHTHADRLAAAVNWGGGIHITFQPDWQERSRHASSYLMDLMATRARLFGGTTFEDYVARCPELSLLDQGVLDQPSCPLLLVNGKDDLQNSPDDMVLALQHGDPKTARFYPGGHMGTGPIMPDIVKWLKRQLATNVS